MDLCNNVCNNITHLPEKLVFPDFVALKINLFVGMFEENRNLFKLLQVFQAS